MDREELKLKLINELIDKGLSDDQILEIVEKHFPLDVVAAPAPSTSVTPQQALNRTVAAVKKVNDKVETKADKAFESIKDISSATTQAEVYALLEVGKTYNWHGSIIRCFEKQPSQAMVRGFGVTNTNEFAMIGIWVHNTADPFTITVPADLDRLSVYTPSSDNHAANKKYVDAIKVYDITGVNVGANTMDGTNDNKLVPTKAYTDSKAAGSLSVIASSGNVDLSTMSGADADKKLTTQAWVNSSISHKISRPKYHSVFWPRGVVNQARGGWVDILTTDKPIENFEIDWFTGYNNDNNPFTQNTGAWSDAKGYSLKIDELGTAVTFLFGNADDWDCGGQFNIRVSGGKLQGYISRPANSMNNGDLAVAFVIKEYVY